MIQPKNGLYLDREDFEQWQDYFSPLVVSSEGVKKKDNIDGDIKTKNITFVVTERCNLKCHYCLSGDTEITMADGYSKIPIKDIKAGDKILGFDENVESHIVYREAIVDQLHHRKSSLIELQFEDGTSLKVTKNHPLLKFNHDYDKFDYIPAGEFIIGEYVYIHKRIMDCHDKLYNILYITKIVNIDQFEEEVDVYNLGTTTRTYIANNVAVHNCYESHKTNRRMTKEVAKQAVDFILDDEKVNGYFNKEDSPAVILEFIGGEPLLEIELMDYIVEYFKFRSFELDHPWSTNYMISFTSNGTLFDNDKVKQFLERNKGRLSIGITIDGNKELHDSCRVFHDGSGSYDIVEKAVKKWVITEEKPQTKITLSPQNITYLNAALKNVWSLGIVGAFTNCVFEEGWETKHAKILYTEMKKLADYLLEDNNYAKYYTSLFSKTIGKPLEDDRNYCGGNGKMLAISPDGKCFPCIRFMKYSLSTPGRCEQPIGDIYNGLDKKEDNLWLNELDKITMTTQCQYEDNKKCLTCKIAQGCSLCTGYNYDKFGTPNHKATFICEMHQARVMANYYYYSKLHHLLGLEKEVQLNIDKELALNIIDEDEYQRLTTL